ncbi:UDP-glucose 4-epimerase family protein [Myxacorys almedinensis]|uniref:NAD-dependent epimerase/dehydratase family protein n=1 Tax=Myxacorys almedinensis A TaxID=2690445 RepID=A0A8J7Z2A0_9CYAN|nr:SDR family oxidoreductase [Myxacorys almedinensis]NDJ18719.1 NAD-dependent epimerase/dehydratase family protein [Myxacorys almedinensis A]
MKLLVTGASGFVGTAFCLAPQLPHTSVYGVVRSDHQTQLLPPQVKPVIAESLSDLAARHDVLSQIDCIVHLAARVHVMHDSVSDPLSAFRAVNTEATRELAIAAAKSGVRRFVYLSSIKVNGEGQANPYTELSTPSPQDPYGISKREAECALHAVAADTGLEAVIIRPPLVYGADVKANFLQLMRLVKRGVPLPFGRVENARSLVYVGNLVDAISACAVHPAAPGRTFLVSDGVAVSTPDLIRNLAIALNSPAHLLPIPPDTLRFFGKITGKSAAIDRLLSSLTIDDRAIRQTLDWQPPFTFQQGLKATATWYNTTH